MSLLIGFFTFILVLNCLVLMLLVLIQLPKKEAGAGVAFGGGATDALFGAGSGNALTKITKYAAGLFVGLSLMLAFLGTYRSKQEGRGLDLELQKKANAPTAIIPSVTPTNAVVPAIVQTNAPTAPSASVTSPPIHSLELPKPPIQLQQQAPALTNTPAAPASNPPK